MFVYGLNFNSNVVKYFDEKWEQQPSNLLRKISIDNDGTVWGLTHFGKIVSFDDYGSWEQIPSQQRFQDVIVGNSQVWIIGPGGILYYYNKETKEITEQQDDIKLLKLDLNTYGCIWAVDIEGNILKREFNIENLEYLDFVPVTKPAKEIIDICAVDYDKCYVIDVDENVYKYGFNEDDKTNWEKIEDLKLRSIDIDIYGWIWGINNEGYAVVFRNNDWEKFDILLYEITAGGKLKKPKI